MSIQKKKCILNSSGKLKNLPGTQSIKHAVIGNNISYGSLSVGGC